MQNPLLLPITKLSFDKLQSDLLKEHEITLTVARLDKIHPEVSGNKLFKLHYFIRDCLQTEHRTILTFGGAYSNHLIATAFLCRERNLKSIGIVRGEESEKISHTLMRCRELGMNLHFTSREEYSIICKKTAAETLENTFGECTVVPEGGYNAEGARGASLIMDLCEGEDVTHICTATGTATTLAGLLRNNRENRKMISVPVIKNMTDVYERVQNLNSGFNTESFEVFGEYHFGGYAKHTNELIGFMNNFFSDYEIPTDFVYTGKMMFAITDKIKKGYFKKGSRILCLHTGGLQGNKSLPPGKLIF